MFVAVPPDALMIKLRFPGSDTVYDVPILSEAAEIEGTEYELGLSIEIGDSAAFHAAALARGLPVAGEIELFAQALAMLREQVFALDHMFMSLFSTLGWLFRLVVTTLLLASIHPALLLLLPFATLFPLVSAGALWLLVKTWREA